MPKQSQLRKTLQQTEASLEKALSDRGRAQQKVQTLTKKIPELQRAVDSLRVLCGEKPKGVMPNETWTTGRSEALAITGEHRAETSAADLAKYLGPQVPKKPAADLTEDDVLPPVSGEPILDD